MNTLILAAIRCSLIFVFSAVAYADSAQWNLDPISGDWNTAGNWTPMTVPNGPADTATFALSNTTNVAISANTEVNAITFTSAVTNPYTIASPGLTLTISGIGIANNSAITQSFVAAADGAFNEGEILFTNNSTAGNATIFNEDGLTTFFNSSTAGNATIWTDFAFVSFWDSSTAGSAYIGVSDSSFLQFANTSTAGSAFLGATGFIDFSDFATASNGIINSAGLVFFDGSSRGDTAEIELLSIPDFGYFGALDIANHSAPGVSIGSIEGDENTFVSLGANNLTVGSNNFSTTFSGVIDDFGFGGSLTKIGTGTLGLSGASTYTGNTNINRGVLQVDGRISSNTFVNYGGALAGSGTVNGNVTNSYGARVSPGDALGVPGVLTVEDNYVQTASATLLIQIAGADAGEVSVLNITGSANLNGYLNPVLVNGFVPEIGQSFTFMNYASFTGFFSHIKDQPFDHGRKRWALVYEQTRAYLIAVENGRPLTTRKNVQMHRRRNDKHGVDPISNVPPFGRLWYEERRMSSTHAHTGDFKEP